MVRTCRHPRRHPTWVDFRDKTWHRDIRRSVLALRCVRLYRLKVMLCCALGVLPLLFSTNRGKTVFRLAHPDKQRFQAFTRIWGLVANAK